MTQPTTSVIEQLRADLPHNPDGSVDEAMVCARLSDTANLLEEAVKVLSTAPIMSKYHTITGFNYVGLLEDYEKHRVKARSLLTRIQGTRT